MADALSDYFDKISDGITVLSGEVEAMISKKDDKPKDLASKDKEGKRIISSKTVEPMTRMRKDVDELKQAQEKPQEQFVLDRINDILV